MEEQITNSQETIQTHNRESKERKSFTSKDDVILLRAVNYIKPWEAAIGTNNGIMKKFDTISQQCKETSGFISGKGGPALRTRFEKLVSMHRGDQLMSMRASGTTEVYEEREQLLQDIVSRIDDWKEVQNNINKEQKEKENAIELSGIVMRQYAMEELCDEDSDHNSYSTDSTNADIQSKKRSRSRKGKKKLTKRQRLDSITSSISSGLASMQAHDIDKYKYLNNRLQFEKLEAEKNRELQERLEVRRAEMEIERLRLMAELERQREERQAAADAIREEKRDKFLLEIVKLISKTNEK